VCACACSEGSGGRNRGGLRKVGWLNFGAGVDGGWGVEKRKRGAAADGGGRGACGEERMGREEEKRKS